MNKVGKLFSIFSIIFITSCSSMKGGNLNNGNIDGVPFNYLYEFKFNNDNYQVLFPSNNDESSFYMYYETEYTTEMSSWVVNYYYESLYLVDNNYDGGEELLLELYNSIINNLEEIETLLGYSIDLRNPNKIYEEEVVINNPFNDKISCVVVDKYIPVRLKNVNEYNAYTISLPIQRSYLAKCEGQIESPIDKQIISWEDFLAISNLYKGEY